MTMMRYPKQYHYYPKYSRIKDAERTANHLQINGLITESEHNRLCQMMNSQDKENLVVAEEIINNKRQITHKTRHLLEYGMTVTYKPHEKAHPNEYERGRVKSVPNTENVFVVFNANGDWEKFHDYTAQSTPINKLMLGW